MTTNGKVPGTTKTTADEVKVPRDLVDQTVSLIAQLPATQVYALLQRWEKAVPDLIQYSEVQL